MGSQNWLSRSYFSRKLIFLVKFRQEMNKFPIVISPYLDALSNGKASSQIALPATAAAIIEFAPAKPKYGHLCGISLTRNS